jgi:hypothetical protein
VEDSFKAGEEAAEKIDQDFGEISGLNQCFKEEDSWSHKRK